MFQKKLVSFPWGRSERGRDGPTPKGQMGAKRSPQVEDAIIESLTRGASIAEACTAAGVSRISFFHWRKDDPELSLRVEEAIKSRIEIVEDVVYMEAKKGNLAAAFKWLENKGDWKNKIDLSGKIKHDINDPKDDDVIRTAEAILKTVN